MIYSLSGTLCNTLDCSPPPFIFRAANRDKRHRAFDTPTQNLPKANSLITTYHIQSTVMTYIV